MEKITFHVEGMACSHCENNVKRALEALEGVESAKVSASGKTAEVSYDPAKAAPGQMRAAIEDAGYDVKD